MADTLQRLESDSAAPVDRQALLTVLTTEHFTLQGARGSTISESSARAALYVGALSSALVALGFIGQGGQRTTVLGAQDDPVGALANMGIARPSRWQLYFTIATVVAFLNAVVGGATVAFALSVLGTPLAASAVAGLIAGAASLWLHLRWQQHAHDTGKHRGDAT